MVSEVRTGADGARGSNVTHSQDIGRPAFVFPLQKSSLMGETCLSGPR